MFKESRLAFICIASSVFIYSVVFVLVVVTLAGSK